MHWLLQNNIFNESKFVELKETLDRFGIPNSEHKVIPFIGEIEPDFDSPDGNVICWGSYSMRHLAKTKQWSPGVFDLFDQDFNQQLAHWGQRMLNHDSQVMEFQNVVFTEDQHFIRPIDDSKYFAGGVFDRYEFEDWQKKVCNLNEDYGNSLRPTTLVQLVNLKQIYREVRYWIVRGEIVTSSVYKIGSRVTYYPNIDETLDHYVRDCIGIWQPADAFVIDVCETPDGPRIVEINTITASGFYAADIPKLVNAFERNF